MLSILLPAARQSSPNDTQTCWGDLRVALASIAAYASDIDVVVGWNGIEDPRHLPTNPRMRLIPQPRGISTGSEAWNWCAKQTEADQLLILGDDCVLHPDTMRLLREDVAFLEERFPNRVGFVGCRSNYVKGPQNIRMSNGSAQLRMQYDTEQHLLEAEMIVPVAAWVSHEVFEVVGGFPATNWFADDVCCWDLRAMGYKHFVSRAYVHHVGERATGQAKTVDDLLAEGLGWLRANRPDFLRNGLLQGAVDA